MFSQPLIGIRFSRHCRCVLLTCILLQNFLSAPALSAQTTALDLTPASSDPTAGHALAEQWLEDIARFIGDKGLREASAQEHTLLEAIEKLAAYYGFISKRYALDQVQTVHSFAANLEILIPAQLPGKTVDSGNLKRRSEIYRSKREVLFLTPTAGYSVLDIVSLLLLMARSSEHAPNLPMRLVFLGSESGPPELREKPAANHSGKGFGGDLIGSRNFLYHYSHPTPYGVLYLDHKSPPRRKTVIRELARLYSGASDPAIQVFYGDAAGTKQLGQALQDARQTFYFSPTRVQKLGDLYREKQWPLTVFRQDVRSELAVHANRLVSGLENFLALQFKQALETAKTSPEGRHYWLWNLQNFFPTPQMAIFSISERQILWLVLLAIV
ncbi:MAG: hypothetical protein AAF975_01195, partial [Spirochaetota bacterium]